MGYNNTATVLTTTTARDSHGEQVPTETQVFADYPVSLFAQTGENRRGNADLGGVDDFDFNAVGMTVDPAVHVFSTADVMVIEGVRWRLERVSAARRCHHMRFLLRQEG